MASKKTFEQSIIQLEKIVEQLESSDLPLETALKKFEEGMKLSTFCSDKLDEIENKVTILLQDQEGNYIEKPFASDDGE